ncbi:MAG: agmatinase [Actinomycetia bacterium]|nr:agmatinase [Actinomycetes bacterium]
MTGFVRAGRFLGCDAPYEQAAWVLFGVPFDGTASFQPGSRFGPPRIREASWNLETYSPRLGRDLAAAAVHDAGDLELPLGNVAASLAAAEAAARRFLADGKRWIALGGEHLVTLPLVRAALERWPDLVVAHFDAHADLRDTYLGERLSHATVLRRVWELVGDGRLFQFGIRSGTAEEWAFAAAHARTFPDAVVEPLRAARAAWAGRPVYVTFDVDVIDPAFLPGTGTPEPGGITAGEAFEAAALFRDVEVVGIDVVETMPLHDTSQRTALVAAKLVREFALAVAGR